MKKTYDDYIRDLQVLLLEHGRNMPASDFYAAVNALQEHAERLQRYIDDGLPGDGADDVAVYVRMEGKTVKFRNIDHFADFYVAFFYGKDNEEQQP